MTEAPRIALIGLGEVGAIFSRALVEAGVPLRVASRRSARAVEAADDLGLPLESAAAVAQTAEIVLLTVPGEALPGVIEEIAPVVRPDTLVADLTAAPPRVIPEAASRLPEARFVDVAIMGAVSLHRQRTPLLASGPAAAAFAGAMNAFGFNVAVQENGAVGDATALKLLRSLFTKGLDAVVVETMLAAEALGLRHQLVEQLADYDRSPLRDHIAMYLRTHPPTAARRLAEMREAEAQLLSLGLPSLTTHGAIARYERTAALVESQPLPSGTLDADRGAEWLLAAERRQAGLNVSSPQRHPEEPAERASRRTHDGPACFETAATQLPQHDAVQKTGPHDD